MSKHKTTLPGTSIKVAILATVAELVCIAFAHSSHRAAVAVVSGQSTCDTASALGWLVVLAEMLSVLVLPPLILATVLGCILHVIANRSFQRGAAVR